VNDLSSSDDDGQGTILRHNKEANQNEGVDETSREKENPKKSERLSLVSGAEN